MTAGVRKTSVGEQRLIQYLRLCDFVVYWVLGASAASFMLGNLRVAGLTVPLLSYGAAAKLAGVISAYLVISSRTPNTDIAPWIRRWTRTASVLGGLVALYGLIAAHDPATKLLAGAVALLFLLLYRRVGSVSIGEKSEGWGPVWGQRMFFLRGVFGPELDVWLCGVFLAGAIIVRTGMPSAFRPVERAVTQYDLKQRVLAVYLAERRYHREHGRYSSDIGDLRPLAAPQVIDSLVVVTVDALGYRAVARDPRGTTTCSGWGGAVGTSLRIEGLGEGNIFCSSVASPR